MPTDEFALELELVTDTARDASAAFAAGDFAESSRLYFEALKEAGNTYGDTSIQAAKCLHGMSDSYYAQDKFLECKSVSTQLVLLLRQLPDEVVAPEQRIAALFKLAKSHEKLQEFDESDRVFAETLVLAQAVLPPGNPQLTTLLEAFANMLRKARKDPKRLADLEERARINRRKFSDPDNLAANILEGVSPEEKPAEKTHVWEPKKKAKKSLFFSTISEETVWLLAMARKHRRLFGAIVCAPFLTAAIVLLVTLTVALKQMNVEDPIPAGCLGAAGQVYVSPYSLARISLLAHGRARVETGAVPKLLRYYVAEPGWTEFLTVFIFHKNLESVWLAADEEGLRDSQGNSWVVASSMVIKEREGLPALARAIDRWLKSQQQQPHGHATKLEMLTDRAGDQLHVPFPVNYVDDSKLTLAEVKDMEQGLYRPSDIFTPDHWQEIGLGVKAEQSYCLNVVGGTQPAEPAMVLFVTDANRAVIDDSVYYAHGNGVIHRLQAGKQAQDSVLNRYYDSIVIARSSVQYIYQIYCSVLLATGCAIVLGFAFFSLLDMRAVDVSVPGSTYRQANHLASVWVMWILSAAFVTMWLVITLWAIYMR